MTSNYCFFKSVFISFLVCFIISACSKPLPLIIEVKTNKGDFNVKLDPSSAPLSTDNFIQYVNDGFYDGLIFHRVIAGFVIQSGGYDKDIQIKTTRGSIKTEADNGLSNKKYSIGMARDDNPDSATSQFYINLDDNNDRLDYSDSKLGYTVFGIVISGTDVIDEIGNVKTEPHAQSGLNDVPVTPVIIESIRIAP